MRKVQPTIWRRIDNVQWLLERMEQPIPPALV
jgi:hypothetical protein